MKEDLTGQDHSVFVYALLGSFPCGYRIKAQIAGVYSECSVHVCEKHKQVNKIPTDLRMRQEGPELSWPL